MPKLPELTTLDLSALIASRVCHDIISPVGAMVNGLEVLKEEQSEEMREVAMDLISTSAASAAAKLKFSRLAFGASGSAGADINTGDAEEVVREFMLKEKPELTWNGARSLVPKNRVKLLLNMILIGLGAIPRGGTIDVVIEDEGPQATFRLTCTGPRARVPHEFVDMLNGSHEGDITPHAVQPYYTILLAQETGLSLSARIEGESVILAAA